MSRTYVHTPYEFTPEGIYQEKMREQGKKYAHYKPVNWRAARRTWGRVEAIRVEAVKGNRKFRHDQDAAIRAGRYDDVVKKFTPRHGAVWDCM